MSRLHELAANGQAIWLDFIRRSHTRSGELARLRDLGVRGVTSNPAIFEKAIAGSADYDDDLQRLVADGSSPMAIYEGLALPDIVEAADVLRPVYDVTGGADGFVSIEVDPRLAHNTNATLAEARRLFAVVNRPNVMIKIPATPAGVPAIEAAIVAGINVNVTLIFSVSQYEPVARAYIAGLEARASTGHDISRVASVASFFVSRVDTLVDRRLEALGRADLAGRAAVANARVAYGRFEALFSGSRWEALAARGARVQRPLWASTGTKNPAYSDCLYVDTLVAPHTVNTLPPATLDAVLDHGTTAPAIAGTIEAAAAALAELAALGIDVDGEVAAELQRDGVQQFIDAFVALAGSIERRQRRQLSGFDATSLDLGGYQAQVEDALAELDRDRVVERIFAGDHTVWDPNPTEIADRLGWLRVAAELLPEVDRLEAFAANVRAEGFTAAVVIGMGGSSLAPEVFAQTAAGDHGLPVRIADSTHPAAVRALADALDLNRTLFLISTKSGSTVETFSLFRSFWRAVAARGAAPGRQFVAITDPGSGLATLAAELGFHATFLANPNIGGRFSALSHFGMVPAALAGAPIRALLTGGIAVADAVQGAPVASSPPVVLGAAIAELAKAGRDKLTLIVPPALEPFGDWFEQLLAESTGKDRLGIFPVPVTALADPAAYGDDRFFVELRPAGDAGSPSLATLREAGHPVLTIDLPGVGALGAQMWTWEFATAVAGARLGINPFDQPDVESAKVQARRFVAAYQRTGHLPELEPAIVAEGICLFGDVDGDDPGAALRDFLLAARAPGRPAPYVALQAFLPPSSAVSGALGELRASIERWTGVATTAGFGPRFLHSTGQLHKGDAGRGLFLQLVDRPEVDQPIPDDPGSDASSMTFGTLIAAQALGDRQALLDAGRRVLRVELSGDLPAAIRRLAALVAAD